MLSKLVLLVVLFGMLNLGYYANSFLKNYGPYALNTLYTSTFKLQPHQQIKLTDQNIQQLLEIPIVRHLFIEEKIYRLSLQRKWQEVIELCQNIQGSFIFQNSYKIWVYKAIAQCATFQFMKCQQSAHYARLIVPHEKQPKYNTIIDTMTGRNEREDKEQVIEEGGIREKWSTEQF